jgi:hypothetical protein
MSTFFTTEEVDELNIGCRDLTEFANRVASAVMFKALEAAIDEKERIACAYEAALNDGSAMARMRSGEYNPYWTCLEGAVAVVAALRKLNVERGNG